jgi:hypothetical protein
MDRIARMCEEIHAYAGSAERTGTVIELRGLKTGQRTCTSLTDLIRKYKLYGDGIFYLPVGLWPKDEKEIPLDNVKWMGVTRAVGAERGAKRKRKRRTPAETDQ